MIAVTPDTITALQPIEPYVGPDWFVAPIPHTWDTSTDELDEIVIVEPYATILERNVVGWGHYNAIIRFDDGFYRADYLARLEEKS